MLKQITMDNVMQCKFCKRGFKEFCKSQSWWKQEIYDDFLKNGISEDRLRKLFSGIDNALVDQVIEASRINKDN